MKTKLLLSGLLLFNALAFAQCFTSVSAGYNHVAGLKPNGTLWVWGWGNWGQQGNSTDFDEYAPHQLTTATNWQVFKSSQTNTFAIKSDGTLWGCGGNLYGGMGIGSTTEHVSVMTQIGTANNWKEIASGNFTTIALKTDNSLWGWGFNDGYQLGNNTCCNNQLTPIQIGTATDWKSVGASYSRSGFAIKNNGTLWCWGTNIAGMLGGNSSVTERTVPTQFNAVTDWDKMSVGAAHILVLKTNGTLWAWGSADFGETGQNPGPTVDIAAPFQIADTWKAVAAGFRFSMGIKTDGTLWGWGINDVGQLGNGTTNTINYIPQQIGTAANWESVSAGYQHTVALRTDGSLWTWGNNDFGQLGNGGTTPSATPTYLPIAGCTLGIDEEAATVMQLSPNPVGTEFSLNYKGIENVDAIVIYDLIGKEVYRIDALGNNAFSTSFNVASLQSGTYLVVLKNKNKKISSAKMIKQ
jgi:alpha-tubulin suppressor-like RCC1 family protein